MRAFEYDGFISHNADDGAKSLAVELARYHAHIFCDELNDFSDKEVIDRMASILMRSRCVVLYVSPTFRDSGWCKAEYAPRSRQNTALGFIRIVVAKADPNISIPAIVRGEPLFDLPKETEPLAQFLIKLNRVPQDISAEFTAQRAGRYGPRLGSRRALLDRDLYLLASFSRFELYVESRSGELGRDVLDSAAKAARQYIDAADIDTRTNAHRVLVLIAAITGESNLAQEIKGYICREPNDSVLIEVIRVYLRAGLPASKEQMIWLGAALLRATEGVKTLSMEHPFLNLLPESVRCRVVEGKIGLDVLPVLERAELLKRRLAALLQNDGPIELEPWEVEGQLTSLLPYLETEGEDKQIRILYRELVGAVLVWSEKRGGEPIQQMGEHACDVLVEPLARLMAEEEASIDAFDRTCRIVAKRTGARDLVDLLRRMGHLVHSGASWSEARAQAHAEYDPPRGP